MLWKKEQLAKMTYIYVMPLHEEYNGYGVLENGGYEIFLRYNQVRANVRVSVINRKVQEKTYFLRLDSFKQ